MPNECPCGSGFPPERLYDARGIYCGLMCHVCELEKRSQFRAEIFTDADYECDEAIDGEDW